MSRKRAVPTPTINTDAICPAGDATRRSFVGGALCLAVTATSMGVLAPARGETGAAEPDAAELELAALGEALRTASPQLAAQIESRARALVGLAAPVPVDWQAARAAGATLTQQQRVDAEFGRGEFISVQGWLLAHSEAATTLLYAAALAGDARQPAR